MKAGKSFLKTLVWLAGISVFAAAVIQGIQAWRRQHDPNRFMQLAESRRLAGEIPAAMEYYRRALRLVDNPVARTGVLLRIAGDLKTLPPQPLRQAANYYRWVLDLLDEASRLEPANRQVVRELLDGYYQLAVAVNTIAAWNELLLLSDRSCRADRNNAYALEYRAIAKIRLLPRRGTNLKEMADVFLDLQSAARELPNEPEPIFYLALCHLLNLPTAENPTQVRMAEERSRLALNLFSGYTSTHPSAVKTRVYSAQLLAESYRLQANSGLFSQVQRSLKSLEEAAGELTPEEALTVGALIPYAAGGGAASWANVNEARQRVEKFYRQYLIAHPESRLVQLALARNLRQQDQRDAAASLLAQLETEIRKEKPQPVGVEAVKEWLLLAEVQFEAVDLELLRQERQAAAGQPVSNSRKEMEPRLLSLKEAGRTAVPWLDLLAGKQAFLEGHWREAIFCMEKVDRQFVNSQVEAIRICGLALARAGEDGAAITRLKQCLQAGTLAETEHQNLQLELLSLYLRVRDFAQALALADDILRDAPQDRTAQLLAIQALLAKGVAEQRLVPGGRNSVAGEIRNRLAPLLAVNDPEALRHLATLEAVTGRPEEAIEALAACREQRPADAEALIQLLYLEYAAGRPQKAWQHVEQSLNQIPDNPAAAAWRRAAAPGQPPVTQLESLIRLAFTPDEASRLAGLYQWLQARKQPGEAKEILEQALKKYPRNRQLLEVQFHDALETGNYPAAEQLLSLYRPELTAEEVDLYLARRDLARGDYSLARKRLETLTTATRTNSTAWVLLGDACRMSGETKQAESHYRQALVLRPLHPGALAGLFFLADAAGQGVQALGYLRQAVLFAPADTPLAARYLDYMNRYGNPLQVMEIRTALARIRPWDQDNRRALARLYLEAAEPAKAYPFIDQLCRENPDDMANVLVLMDYYQAVNNMEEGRQRFAAFLLARGSRTTAEDWLAYARFLAEHGFQQALPEVLLKVIPDEDPVTMPASSWLGNWCYEQGEYHLALALYRRVLDGTGNPEARLGVVEALLQLKQYPEAEKELRLLEKSKLDPMVLLFCAARLAAGQGRLQEARQSCDRLIAAKPDYPQAYALRGELRFQDPAEQNREGTGEDLEKALRLKPDLAQTRERLVDWLLLCNRPREAIPQLKQLIEQQPGRSAYAIRLGRLFLALGDITSLDYFLPEWEKRCPAVPEWHEFRSQLLAAQGQMAAAAETFGRYYWQRQTVDNLRIYLALLLQAGKAEDVLAVLADTPLKVKAEAPTLLLAETEALLWLRRMDEAAESLPAAIRLSAQFPDQIQATMERIRRLLPPAELIRFYTAVEKEDRSGMAALYHARLLIEQGDLPAGLKMLEDLLRQAGTTGGFRGRVYFYLGTAYHLAGRPDAAQQSFAQALLEFPDNPVLLNNAAMELAEGLNRPLEAIVPATKAVALARGNPALEAACLDTLGYAQFKAALPFQARDTFRQSLRLAAMPETHLHLGDLFLHQQQPEEAKREYEAALRLAAARKNLAVLKLAEDRLKPRETKAK